MALHRRRALSSAARVAAAAPAMSQQPKRALLPIAPGSEDIETLCISDILRRAGVHVDIAAVTTTPGQPAPSLEVTLARGARLVADVRLDAVPLDAGPPYYDLIALPGGMPGTTHLAAFPRLTALLRGQAAGGRWVAAICASPAVVLAAHGLLAPGTRATAHAGFASRLPNTSAVEERVVVDEAARVVTSRGPGTSIEFALQLVACLLGGDKAREVAAPLHLAPEQARAVAALR